MIYVVLSLIVSLSSVYAAKQKQKLPLRLGRILSQQGEYDNSGAILTFDLALETVNNDPSLNYTFQAMRNDSMVSVCL